MELTLAAILTAGGAVAAAGLVKGLISIFKTLPAVGGSITKYALEPVIAFVLSAVLVIIAALAAVQEDPSVAGLPFYFMAFLAWYGIARLSMAIHDDIAQNPNSLTGVRLGSFDVPEDNDEPPAVDISTTEDDSRPTGPVI